LKSATKKEKMRILKEHFQTNSSEVNTFKPGKSHWACTLMNGQKELAKMKRNAEKIDNLLWPA
jgi:hypothetical protein